MGPWRAGIVRRSRWLQPPYVDLGGRALLSGLLYLGSNDPVPGPRRCTVRLCVTAAQGVRLVIRTRLIGTILATAIAIMLPAAVTAQDEPVGPEGVDWALTSYVTDEATATVPFAVDATLRLEDGQASGSGGCNAFTGSYQLDGASIDFSDELTRTLKLCEEDIQAVEDGYLTVLPEVTGWAIVAEVLELSDAFGDTILTFEVPSIGLTSSDVAGLMQTLEGLQTEIDTLRRDMRRLNVDKLRERIKVLESESKKLKEQVASAEKATRATPQAATFSSAEKILLRGIPPRISSRCSPLRASLPKGTKSAVRCAPNTSAVSSVDYYLMEEEDAIAVFSDTMTTFNVPQVTEDGTCEVGTKSQRQRLGYGWQAEGCYRTGGRAEVRFVENATEGTQLKVGGKCVRSPKFYVAVQGSNTNVARAHDWATGGLVDESRDITSIAQPIVRPDEKSCGA